MPTYDYVCDACDHQFELMQSIKDEPKKKCPECGKPKLRRLIGAGLGIIFKGSGFYQTDYRSESYKQKAEAEKKATESKPAETKSESKPDSSSTSSGGTTESKPKTATKAKKVG
jgi:putative FmdB family regulatory protein